VAFEDALQASRAVMKRALTEIAWYGQDAEARRVAQEALRTESVAYSEGVRKAETDSPFLHRL
jgi:hypothetical protein